MLMYGNKIYRLGKISRLHGIGILSSSPKRSVQKKLNLFLTTVKMSNFVSFQILCKNIQKNKVPLRNDQDRTILRIKVLKVMANLILKIDEFSGSNSTIISFEMLDRFHISCKLVSLLNTSLKPQKKFLRKI